jgi:tetraacyldisaccharide 4'-kinase
MYGAAATWRRRWYAQPARARRLGKPVVSVGNLRAGGSGKTPVVAHIARLLASRGERPAILSRGYARTRTSSGVTIVSDGTRLRTDVAHAGDEPFMLAQALPDVAVLVDANRFRAGMLAERELGVTVHVLDDGFQHVALERDIDLLLVDSDDLKDSVLPIGRLREPIANASVADAILVSTGDIRAAEQLAATLGVSSAFRVSRVLQPVRTFAGPAIAGISRPPIVAFAGIARPERFYGDLQASGWSVAARMTFPDHHPYQQRDVDRVVAAARHAGTTMALTTEKDAVRLSGLDFGGLTVGVIPLTASIEPAGRFAEWLMLRLATRDRPR